MDDKNKFNPRPLRPVLVKTWLDILHQKQVDDDARARAIEMIEKNFGTIKNAIEYLQQEQEPA